jgi:ketopantoate reductase
MNIIDYFTKVKNLTNVFASIKAPINDENLVAVTLNGLGKYYSQFCTSIII